MLANPLECSILQHQIQKLSEIDSVGYFTNEFLMGYIAASVNSPTHKYEWKNLWSKLEYFKKMVVSKIVSPYNIMEVVEVSLAKYKNEKLKGSENFEQLLKILNENFNEVIIDQKYLKKKYFTPE